MEKICKMCGPEVGLKELKCFEKAKQCPDGHLSTCKICRRKVKNANYRKNYKLNSEKLKHKSQKWRKENPAKLKEYKLKTKDREKQWFLDDKKKNPAKYKERNKKWKQANKGLVTFYTNNRRAQKLNATLEGYREELKEIYKNCPEGYEVDHIMPLMSNQICGLHVPWNLQYLTPKENRMKSNKIIGDL